MIPISVDAMRLLHEGAMVLSKIEANGVRVNTDYLKKTILATEQKIKDLEAELRAAPEFRVWKKRFGASTNTDSYSQLGVVIFGKECLGHEVKGYTATGKVAAGKDQIDDLDLPFAEIFVHIQNLKTKVLGTYLKGIQQEMVLHPDGFWYVHPFYNIHTVSTFRSSSNSPNFQNQPKRNPEMAELIRPNYEPHPGQHFVEADFSQLEVRISACYHNDPNMIRYIEDPSTDMHTDTCMEMFLLSKAQVDKKTSRDSAKNQFVFPQFYGSNYVNCCKAIWKSMRQRNFRVGDVSMFDHLAGKGIKERGDCVQGQDPKQGTFEAHLRKVEKIMWDKRFRVYTQWKRAWFDAYCRAGGFRMKTGFAVNGVFKRNDVTNYPIQGSAFHCLLWVLIELQKWLTKYKLKSKIIGEIHDAVQMSVEPRELQDVLHKLLDLMTRQLPKAWSWINVPLQAEIDVGPVDHHWLTCKTWECRGGDWRLAS